MFKALFERLVSEFQLQFCLSHCLFFYSLVCLVSHLGGRMVVFSTPRGLGEARFHEARKARESSEEETLRGPSEKATVALPFSLVDWDKSVIDHLITCPFKIPSLPVGQGQETDYPGERSLTQRKSCRNLINNHCG